MSLLGRAAAIGAQVHTTVDPRGLPGGALLQRLLNGLVFVSLITCTAAIVFGGATWWLASNAGNSSWATGGRKAVFAGLVGAILVGASAALVNFFYAAGRTVH
jgi:hypothetical protein